MGHHSELWSWGITGLQGLREPESQDMLNDVEQCLEWYEKQLKLRCATPDARVDDIGLGMIALFKMTTRHA